MFINENMLKAERKQISRTDTVRCRSGRLLLFNVHIPYFRKFVSGSILYFRKFAVVTGIMSHRMVGLEMDS